MISENIIHIIGTGNAGKNDGNVADLAKLELNDTS